MKTLRNKVGSFVVRLDDSAVPARQFRRPDANKRDCCRQKTELSRKSAGTGFFVDIFLVFRPGGSLDVETIDAKPKPAEIERTFFDLIVQASL